MIKETNGVRVEMTFEDKKMFVDNFDMSEIYEQLPNYEFFDRYMKEEKKLERYKNTLIYYEMSDLYKKYVVHLPTIDDIKGWLRHSNSYDALVRFVDFPIYARMIEKETNETIFKEEILPLWQFSFMEEYIGEKMFWKQVKTK